MDLAYAFLSRKISVDQTRGTSLVEISVRNPNPDLAATIANTVADVYRQYRQKYWEDTHSTGIESLKVALSTNQAALAQMTADLDKLRADLKISDLDEPNPLGEASILVETMRILENRRIEAQGEFEDYSDTQSNLLVLKQKGLLHEALPTALASKLDPDWRSRRRMSPAPGSIHGGPGPWVRHKPPNCI